MKIGLNPGSIIIAIVNGDELHLKRRKTIVDLLDEDAIASVSYVEPGKERSLLEKKLMNR